MPNRRHKNSRKNKNQSIGHRVFLISPKTDLIDKLRAEQLVEGRKMMLAEMKENSLR